MIKIKIKNPEEIEEEYLDLILGRVKKRLVCVKKVIDRLNGSTITINTGEISFVKAATIDIIEQIDADKKNSKGEKFSSKDFNKGTYEGSINYYIANDNNIDSAQLRRISRLYDQLLSNDCLKLKNLLICKPSDLKSTFEKLTTKLTLPNDLFLVKLSFNYEEYNEISSRIRSFFRKKNFIEYCPYCNLDKVKFLSDENDQIAARHDLDHFFDKATFPLLCYTFYNLVPSDTTCNQTNKGTIEFTHDYHLNPYEDGFNNSLVFKAGLSNSKINRYSVEIRSNETTNTNTYKKIFGKHEDPGNLKYGNVNAFKLKARYKDEKHQAKFVASKLDLYDKGWLESLGKYFNLLKKDKLLKSYHTYYLKTFNTPFQKECFGNFKYAKMNRDIHDQYYDYLFGNDKSIKEKLQYIFKKTNK